MESARELRGVLVATREEGIILGPIQGIQIDPQAKCISALVIRGRKGPKRDLFVKVQDVEKLGEDIVLIRSKGSVEPFDKDDQLPGRSLRDMQGCWVTTMAGKHLGTLVDLDFSSRDWKITELEMAEHKALPVDPNELTIGDEILVPEIYADRIKALPIEKYGAMGRFLGEERIDDLRDTIGRVLKRPKEPTETPPKGPRTKA